MNISLPYRLGNGRLARLGLVAATVAVLVALITPNLAHADVIIAEDDFEGHASGPTGSGWVDDWTFNGNAGFRDDAGPHSGNSHLRVRDEDASAVRSADITGESSLRLQSWIKFEEFDDAYGVLEVSNDGSTYAEVRRWDEDDEDDEETYIFYDFDLATTGLSFTNQLWVRARIVPDDDDDAEGTLYLDDITLINSADDPDPEPPSSGIPVLIDGEFPDWPGKTNLADPLGDQSGSSRRDIAAFYWANNIDEEINFHMLERHTTDGQPFDGDNGQDGPIRYLVTIDTNNNGNFTESEDRRAVITYIPKSTSSLVNVKIYPGDSFSKISDSGWNDWGDSRAEGGLRVEFPLDWSDLDIEFGGVIRMYAESFDGLAIFPIIGDRVPDGTADIQWSPASVLGPWLLGGASIFGIGVIWFLSRRRKLWT